MVTGALIELILVFAVVGIAAMLYPVLRRHDEGLALWYLGGRLLEAVALVAALLPVIIAAELSEVEGGLPPQPLDTLVATRDWSTRLGQLVMFGGGALILYTLLYRARLVPTWLSLWGLTGAALILVRGVIETYTGDISPAGQVLLAGPIGVNEMVLAVWLIAKGFAASGAEVSEGSDRPQADVPTAAPATV